MLKMKMTDFDLCGIYAIHNTITKAVYIGQSKMILSRWDSHFRALKAGKPGDYSIDMQEDFNLYKASAFEFEILELCNEDKLREKEKQWIYKFVKTGVQIYNTTHMGPRKKHNIRRGFRPCDTCGSYYDPKDKYATALLCKNCAEEKCPPLY